jgi:D-glycero-D-manno-heptose 1,7-bisphosphate phosphatase
MPRLGHRAVFLDRDGVLSRVDVIDGKGYAPRQFSRFQLLPGAKASVARLKRAGYLVVVATNQPDIGNNRVSARTVAAMHAKLGAATGVDAIFMCPHRQDAGCDCRKPRDGMLREAALAFGIRLHDSWMVGDRWSDVVAGQRAGCRTAFIDRGYTEPADLGLAPDAVARTLPAAVRALLAQGRRRT